MKYVRIALMLLLCSAAGASASEKNLRADEVNSKGINFLISGDNIRAEKKFRKAVSISPEVKHYHNNLGVSLMRQGRYSEAAVFLRAAVSLDPGYVKAVSNLAITEFYLFNFRSSLILYRRAVTINPAYAEGRLNRKTALPRIRRLADENPDNGDLKNILKYLEDNQ